MMLTTDSSLWVPFTISNPVDIESLPYPTLTLANYFDYNSGDIVEGVWLTWSFDPRAARFAVYRYNESKKKWVLLEITNVCEYLDQDVNSGSTYKYAVKVISPAASALCASKSIRFIAAPRVTVSVDGAGYPLISWKKVPGAPRYRAFYKPNGGSWTKINDTTGTSMEFKSVSNYFGEYVDFTVRCVSSDGKKFISAYDRVGSSAITFATPTVTAKMRPDGYALSWIKDEAVDIYNVLVKSPSTNNKWKVVAKTASNSYVFKGVKNREPYYFAVRAVYASEVASGLRSTEMQTYTTAPKITKIVNSGGYTTATYGKVTGAAKYRLFAWDGKKWIAKGTAYGNAIKFKNNADGRKNRILMVRAMNSKGALISSYWESSLASNGKITYYLPGALTSKNTF